LIGEFENGDLGQIDLLTPGKLQQQVERTLEPVEIDRKGGLAFDPVVFECVARLGRFRPPNRLDRHGRRR